MGSVAECALLWHAWFNFNVGGGGRVLRAPPARRLFHHHFVVVVVIADVSVVGWLDGRAGSDTRTNPSITPRTQRTIL